MNNDIELSVEDFYDPVGFQHSYLKQVPHKKQEEVLLSPNKNKIIVCGRRSGKTQMIAGEIIRGGVLKLYKKQMVVAPTYKQTLIVYYKIIELMQNAKVYDDIEKCILSPRPKIIFKNNSYVDFGSADNPDSLRGEAYDRLFKDESAFIKTGAKNAIKPLTYDTGAPIWDTTTPWGKGEVWELWQRGLKGDEDYGCFHYNYKDNPYLHDEGIKEIEKDIADYGEDSLYVQAEVYGNFIEDQDVYFTQELVSSCVEDYEIPHGINKKFDYYLGVDFARMGQDNSVFIIILFHAGGGKVMDIIETKHKLLTDAIGRVINLNEQYEFEKILTDETGLGSGPTDVLVEKFGYKVQGMHFTTKSKQDIYSNLKRMMQQRKIIIPNNKKLIYELLDLRYEIMSSGDLKIHHSERGHDDYPDALALACWAAKESDYNFSGKHVF